jgi:hypothetical protein
LAQLRKSATVTEKAEASDTGGKFIAGSDKLLRIGPKNFLSALVPQKIL